MLIIIKPYPLVLWSSFPWDKGSPHSHSMLVWRLIHNKIPTNENLKLRGFSFSSVCSLCLDHLFSDCGFAKNLWKWMLNILHLNLSMSCLGDCRKVIDKNLSPQAKTVVKACVVGIFYHVWSATNKARFEDLRIQWKTCISLITAQVQLVGNIQIEAQTRQSQTSPCSKDFISSLSLVSP